MIATRKANAYISNARCKRIQSTMTAAHGKIITLSRLYITLSLGFTAILLYWAKRVKLHTMSMVLTSNQLGLQDDATNRCAIINFYSTKGKPPQAIKTHYKYSCSFSSTYLGQPSAGSVTAACTKPPSTMCEARKQRSGSKK